MPTVGLLNKAGEKVGDIQLNENVFGAEVSGGGIKPWRQKGTGRARQGSIRSPQWIHGGIVFAPKPRDYRMAIPKSMKRTAMRSVLTSKVQENEIFVLEDLSFETPKTKEAVAMFKALNLKKALVVVAESNENTYKSIRNIQGVAVVPVNNINVYDLLKYENLIITKDAVSKIEEVYA